MSRSSHLLFRLLVAAFLALLAAPTFAINLDARSFGKFIAKYACAASPTSVSEVAACKPKVLCRSSANGGGLGFLVVDTNRRGACVIPSFDSQGNVLGVTAELADFELVH